MEIYQKFEIKTKVKTFFCGFPTGEEFLPSNFMNSDEQFYFKLLLLILLSFKLNISVLVKYINRTILNLKLTKKINQIPAIAVLLNPWVAIQKWVAVYFDWVIDKRSCVKIKSRRPTNFFVTNFFLLNKEHHGFGTKNKKSETDFK